MKFSPVLRCLFGAFRQVSSVMMPASLPLQLAEIPQKFAAPKLTFLVRWGLNLLNVFVIASVMSGCYSNHDFDEEVKGVLDGVIFSDDFPVVVFTASMMSDEEDVTIADKIIRWGKVTLSDGEKEVILTGGPNQEMMPPYRYYTFDMIGEPGKTYTVKAEYKDIEVSASGYMYQPTKIDYVEVKEIEESEQYAMSLHFTSPDDGPAYYYVSLRNSVKEMSLPAFMGVARTDNSGEPVSILVMKPKKKLVGGTYEPYFKADEEWEVRLNRVSENVYDYWRLYFNALLTNSSPITGGSVSLQGNVKNGYGIFCVCGSDSRIITIAPGRFY